jgi:hypothetical protein
MLLKLMLVVASCLPRALEERPATTGDVEVAATVSVARETVASVVALPGGLLHLLPGATPAAAPDPAPLAGGTTGTAPDQVLTTTVQDPAHPNEPWVVTTYRRPDESEPAFLKRHLEMVAAVRAALK